MFLDSHVPTDLFLFATLLCVGVRLVRQAKAEFYVKSSSEERHNVITKQVRRLKIERDCQGLIGGETWKFNFDSSSGIGGGNSGSSIATVLGVATAAATAGRDPKELAGSLCNEGLLKGKGPHPTPLPASYRFHLCLFYSSCVRVQSEPAPLTIFFCCMSV